MLDRASSCHDAYNGTQNSTVAAMHFGDKEARRICEQDRQLTERIVALYRKRKSSREIVEELGESLQLHAKGNVEDSTKCGIVQRIVAKEVPESEREKIHSDIRRDIYVTCACRPLNTARTEYMEQQGLVVFSDEESNYLFELRSQRKYKIPPSFSRCDNQKIADAMNDHFRTKKFTKDNCRQRAANQIHAHKKRRDKNRIATTSAPSSSQAPQDG